MEDLIPEERSRAEGPRPGGPEHREAAGWADVAFAQEALERRMRSRWWFHLPEGLGVAGVVAFILHPGAPLLLYVCSLFVAVMPRSLYVSLRGLEPRYFASTATAWVLAIGLL